MHKSEMRIVNLPSLASQRYRPVLITLLLLLCMLIFFYHLVPNFTRATDDFMLDLATRLRDQEFCTKEVGGARCCRLFLDAAPCVDECQKQHMNRMTFMLTKEYEVCADECLGMYNEACPRVGTGVER
jgi:hypothetical protein